MVGFRIVFMFDSGLAGGSGTGGGRTPGRVLADRIVARDARMRAEELGTVWDLKSWLDLHSVDSTDPFANGIAGGAGRRSGSDGTPLVDEYAVREYAALLHLAEPTARAWMSDVADLEHRFPKLWAAVQALWLPVWQARKIVAACRELSKDAAALVDAEMAAVVAGLPWSRILTKLGAAIMQADPALAEKKRVQAKSARFVQLCRFEDGINTMIVRADAGDLVMVYALVDRLADILALEGNTEPADQRRATAFGLLAQPAMVLEMLLRHAHDGTTSPNRPVGSATTPLAESKTGPGDTAARGGTSDVPDPVGPLHDLGDPEQRADKGQTHTTRPPTAPESEAADDGAEPALSDQPPAPDPCAEPPGWTAEDYDEPPDPAPVDHPNIPDHWQQRIRPRPAPEPPAPGWHREPDDPDPPDDHDPPDRSGLHLDLPGPTDLLTQQGLGAARPRVVLNVYLTDQTLATGTGVVRTDHSNLGPLLATQLREFLTTHTCHITVRPILDLDRIPAVDAYEIPHQIRETVRHRNVASVFPYSGATSPGMDLDHTNPYRWTAPPARPDRRTSDPSPGASTTPKPTDCGPSPARTPACSSGAHRRVTGSCPPTTAPNTSDPSPTPATPPRPPPDTPPSSSPAVTADQATQAPARPTPTPTIRSCSAGGAGARGGTRPPGSGEHRSDPS